MAQRSFPNYMLFYQDFVRKKIIYQDRLGSNFVGYYCYLLYKLVKLITFFTYQDSHWYQHVTLWILIKTAPQSHVSSDFFFYSSLVCHAVDSKVTKLRRLEISFCQRPINGLLSDGGLSHPVSLNHISKLDVTLALPTAAAYTCALNCLDRSREALQHIMNLPWSKKTSSTKGWSIYIQPVTEVR